MLTFLTACLFGGATWTCQCRGITALNGIAHLRSLQRKLLFMQLTTKHKSNFTVCSIQVTSNAQFTLQDFSPDLATVFGDQTEGKSARAPMNDGRHM